MKEHVDFDHVNRVALGRLPDLLARWLSDGRMEGREYVALNPRRPDAHRGSFKINIDTGAWADFAVPDAKGRDPLSLYSYLSGRDRVAGAHELADLLGVAKANGKGNGSANAGARKGERKPIVPVPPNAPPCGFRHPMHGRPTATWRYYTAEGELHHLRLRFDFLRAGEPDKEVLPVSYCLTSKGATWLSKAPKPPWPLYNLPALLQRPGVPVLITEGEKKADAAASRLPGYAAISPAGGCKAPAKSDWSPLKGRHVVIWPDADDVGAEFARHVARRCLAANAAGVAIVALPAGLPKSWDLADQIPPGFHLDVAALVAAAVAVEAEETADEETESDDHRLPQFSDEALALDFAAQHSAELRYVAAWSKWLLWDGARWDVDETMRAFDLARAICRDAAARCKTKARRAIASAKTVAAVANLARADRRHAASTDDWDVHPHLLNTPIEGSK